MQPIEWIEIVALIAFSLVVLFFASIIRGKRIAISKRLLDDRRSWMELLYPALLGFCASLFATALYVAVFVGTDHRQPSSHQTVCMFAINAGAGLLMIQAVDVFQKRNNLRLRDLPMGMVFGLIGALAVIPLVLATTLIVQAIMRHAGAAPPEEHSLLLVFQRPVIIDRLLVILSAVILAPFFEELTFRAHLQAAIRRGTRKPWLAIVLASTLFALVHGIWWMMPPLFVLALGLGYVYDRTRNIWATIAIHAAFNALSLSVEFLSMNHHQS